MEDDPLIPDAGEPGQPAPEQGRVPSLEEMAALLPQYEFHAQIGVGGMGAVFLARQPALDRMVAIKVTPPLYEDQADEAARFITEARAMAKLVHPHIVAVFDFGQTGEGHLFIVMEHIEGADLQSLIRARQVDHTAAAAITHQLCDALQFAHEHRVVHRDIKPSNILITAGPNVKVADFGLAKDLSDPASADDGYGTPDYAAPERFIAGAPLDPRTDIFSLGVLMHEMLCGLTPRQAADRGGVALPSPFGAVIARCLLADPARRFQTARDVKAALAAPPRPPPPSAGAPHAPHPHPRPVPHAVHHHAPAPRPAVPGFVWVLGSLAIIAALGWMVLKGRQNETPAVEAAPSATSATPAGTTAPATAPGPAGVAAASSAPSQVTVHRDAQALLMQALPAYLMPDGEPGEVKQLIGHESSVSSVFILPDQRRIISASFDDTLRLWDAQEGRELGRIGDSSSPVSRALLSGDGTKLLGVGRSGFLILWDLATGTARKLKTTVAGEGGVIPLPVPLALSPDGKAVVFAKAMVRGKLWKWKVDESDEAVALPDVPFTPRKGMALPDGTILVHAYEIVDRKFTSTETLILDWEGKTVRKLASLKYYLSSLRLSPDGSTLAAASTSVELADWKSDKRLSMISGHENTVMDSAFLDGGRLLLTGSFDRSMRIWDVPARKELVRYDAPVPAFSTIAVSKDERWAVTGGTSGKSRETSTPADYTLRIWRLPKLATLGDPAGIEETARSQLASLATTDPELAAAKAEADAAAKAATLDDLSRQIGDLNSKYLAALRREAGRASPADSKALLEEAQRVAAGEFIDPEASDAALVPGLRRMRAIYREQLLKLESDHNTAAKAAAEMLNTKTGSLAEKRRAAGDTLGEARIRALITSMRGEVRLSKVFGVFGTQVVPLPQ